MNSKAPEAEFMILNSKSTYSNVPKPLVFCIMRVYRRKNLFREV
jgi:hypothetical protein